MSPVAARDTSRRLLVAESDPGVRHLLLYRLTMDGFDVVEVAEPSTVTDKLSVEQPDMVLLEVAADRDLEVLVELRKLTDAGVIALLPSNGDHDAATVLDLGADDCVARPLNLTSLVSRVRAVLGGHDPNRRDG